MKMLSGLPKEYALKMLKKCYKNGRGKTFHQLYAMVLRVLFTNERAAAFGLRPLLGLYFMKKDLKVVPEIPFGPILNVF